MSGLDLSLIPAPDAIQVVDHAAKVAEMKAQLVAAKPSLAPVLALASEPLVKLIEDWAYEAILKANEINQGVRAMLLTEAVGADLDNVAANLTVARLDGESDAAFRQRAALGPEGWSTAGPVLAYVFHAMSASPMVADVAVASPEPGEVRIAVLSAAEDGIADAPLLAVVASAVNADEVRPLTDAVTVVSAAVAGHDLEAVLKVRSGPDAGPVVALAEAAARAYAAGRRRLNMAVTRNGYIAALMRPGVEDVELTSPAADIPAEAETAPVLDEVSLTVEVLP